MQYAFTYSVGRRKFTIIVKLNIKLYETVKAGREPAGGCKIVSS
jgi:hypothetical protein